LDILNPSVSPKREKQNLLGIRLDRKSQTGEKPTTGNQPRVIGSKDDFLYDDKMSEPMELPRLPHLV